MIKVFNILLVTKDNNIIRPLCVVLSQMSGYTKYFYDGGKNISFLVEDYIVLTTYNKIWNKIKKTLNIKFHCKAIYDEKYLKTKVNAINEVINTIFSDYKIPKESINYICITAIYIDNA